LAFVGYIITYSPFEDDLAAFQYVSSIIKHTPGRVLSESSGPLVLNGKTQDIMDFSYSLLLSNSGHWDQSVLVDDIASKRFDLIILRNDKYGNDNERFTHSMSDALYRNYVLNHTLNGGESGDFYLYTPLRN